MKSIKIIFFLGLFFTLNNEANAQFKDWLNKKKQEAKQKVNNKIDQKSSEGIDKAIDAPETAIKKKKEKKANKTEVNDAMVESETTSQPATQSSNGNNQPVEIVNESPNENGSTIIQTNIKCETGKKNIVKLLKKKDGVKKVDINTSNGELNIEYSSDGISYTELISTINENGFIADGNPATNKKNGCK